MQYVEFPFDSPNNRATLADFRYEKEDGPVLVFCHGFKGFKDWGHFNLVADYWAKLGYRVLKFNFSHNGGTVDNPIDFPDLEAFSQNSYLKEVDELSYVLFFLINPKYSPEPIQKNLRAHKPSEIFVVGHSRGAGVGAIACAEHDISGFAGWAGVADFLSRLPESKIMDKWKAEGVRFIQNGRTKQDMPMDYSFVLDLLENQDRLDIPNALSEIADKSIWLHGDEDEAVSYEAALKLKNKVDDLTFYPLPQANHTFGGKHPYTEKALPIDTERAILITHDFFTELMNLNS